MSLTFDADAEELALFLAENNDHLQLLDQHLVRLETEPDDPTLLQTIFRSAHTIKGGAGLIGHQRMTALAHAMESVLDALRARSLAVSPPLIDALLAALDALRVLNEEVVTREPSPIELDTVLAALSACLRPRPVSAPAEIAEVAPAPIPLKEVAVAGTKTPAPSEGGASPARGDLGGRAAAIWGRDDDLDALLATVPPAQVYLVEVAVDPDCGLAAARTYQAYMELGRAARVLRVDPTPETIEREPATCGLRALVVTAELPSLLEHALTGVADVTEAHVASLQDLDAAYGSSRPDAAAGAGADGAEPASPTGPVAAEPRPDSAAGAVMSEDERAAATISTPSAPAARPAAPATSSASAPGGNRPAPEATIRIAVGIVDDLMNLVSELVLGRTRLQTLRAALHALHPDDPTVAALQDAVGHIDHVSAELQATVMKARMLPVENVFNKFPRLMRDLAALSGKRVTFAMHGQETELDRSVIEQLSDPLIHLLRNAIDHGMETPEERVAAGKAAVGAITLSAAPAEGHITIEVTDDGRGIDGAAIRASAIRKGFISSEAAERLGERESVELIFAPGFSTAKAITDISGRGVGMDIVKAAIERLGGHIEITSVLGVGTTFRVTLPLTLAIMQALLVALDGAVYAIPLGQVTEILSVPSDAVHQLQGTEAILVRGTILPLVRLRARFGIPPAPPTKAGKTLHIVATRANGQPLGLVVDHFIGEQEIVMKPLGAYIGGVSGIAGATILGDGRIGLLLDVPALRDPDNTPAPLSAIA